MSTMLKVFLWISILFLIQIKSSKTENSFDTVFGKLKKGFHLAGKLLGLDQSNNIADLVSEAFGKMREKKQHFENKNKNGGNMFSGFIKVLGFESKKISAVAVNAIIFVAQLISSTLSLKAPSKLEEARAKTKSGTPLKWMLEKSNVLDLFPAIDDKQLSENVIEYVKENSLDEETGCVQLLICKTAPFIWGMQKAINNRQNSSSTPKGINALFEYVPSIDEVAENADNCETKHPYCFVDLN